MKYIQVKAELAQFSINDLVEFLGYEKASEFLRCYRHQIKLLFTNDLRINCTNLGELVARFKDNNFLG